MPERGGASDKNELENSSITMAVTSAAELFDSLVSSSTTTDETVKEYVCSLLEEADPEDDQDELMATLQAFLEANCEDEAEQAKQAQVAQELVQQWMAHKKQQATPAFSVVQPDQQQPQSTVTPPLSPTRSPVTSESDEPASPDTKAKNRKLKQQQRKERKNARKQKRHGKASNNRQANEQEGNPQTPSHKKNDFGDDWADKDDDDFATAWNECKEQGVEWGGRGRGGRGVQAGSNSIHGNIHLANVTVSVPGGGLELLNNAQLDLTKGHRYGLIGRNGCGKSTLMRRLAAKNIPGLPQDLRILLVQQEMEGSETETALQVLLKADTYREHLLREQEDLEQRLEATDDGDVELLEEIATRLGEVSEELDAMSADQAETKALEILKGLQFSKQMIHSPTQNLSGGWRVRLALARALFIPSDILLLDETSNHLDIWGVQWLTNYLTNESGSKRVVVIVSHDRAFLDAVCTDIMVIEHGKLKTFPGSWSDYELTQEEKVAHKKQMLDANERQRAKAEKFIQKQQAAANKKSADPNKQRQAKMMKEKKLDRIGMYREDGHKFKNFSLAKLDENALRLAEKVVIEADEPVVRMKFPNPTWPPGVAQGSPLILAEDFSFGYRKPGGDKKDDKFLLNDLTLNINRGSKVALVGKNGSGKSTLLKLLTGDIHVPTPDKYIHRGSLSWKHSNLRIGHITQYSVEELDEFAHMTVVEYAEEKLAKGKASSAVVKDASGNVRQYLGAFGLGGIHAHRKIEKLSGGERMRLCFATVFAEEPHILVLDESTNHVDVETLDSMAAALRVYEGAVLMVSHNQSFLSVFCKELWVVEDNGSVTVNYDDTESFDELFSDYRASVLSDIGGSALTNRRKDKANMARKAKQQRAGATRQTALL